MASDYFDLSDMKIEGDLIDSITLERALNLTDAR